MRITNKMLSNNFLRDMRTNLNNLSTLQNQMASGKQIRRPSDDPAKASKIMQMYSDIDANKQYNSNIQNTSNWLDTTDKVLGQIGDVTTRIQELLISAGNAGYGPDERAAVKDEINQKVGELSQMLNTNFDGKYLFGGTNGTTPPVGTADVDGNTELLNNVKSKVVAKLTAGEMTSGTQLNTDIIGITIVDGEKDTFNIDGKQIDMEWSKYLSADEQTQIKSISSTSSAATLSSVKDTLVGAINKAIDDSGTGVSHIFGELDSSNYMVLKSGTTGTISEVTLTTVGVNTTIGAKILSDVSGSASSSENIGTRKYSGTTVVKDTPLNMTLNGVEMTVTINKDITEDTTDMEDVASSTGAANIIKDSINKAIDTANEVINAANIKAKITPENSGYIKYAEVTVSDDGRFDISSPSGTISFYDKVGETAAGRLGLSVDPKDKLLVEVSQGVTMDYNVTASQVINYGEESNNLMNLLANITKHLGTTATPNEISALSGSDLTGIQAFSTNVLKLRSQVGAKQNTMESAQTRNDENNLNMTEILSATEDIDITEKAMEYATMQTIYLASLQTSAKVIQPSLLDYL